MEILTVAGAILGLLVSGLSLLTGVVGAIAWIQAKTKKQYAAERDFNHLKKNYEQLSGNVEQLWRQMDENYSNTIRQLDRIEGFLRANTNS